MLDRRNVTLNHVVTNQPQNDSAHDAECSKVDAKNGEDVISEKGKQHHDDGCHDKSQPGNRVDFLAAVKLTNIGKLAKGFIIAKNAVNESKNA